MAPKQDGGTVVAQTIDTEKRKRRRERYNNNPTKNESMKHKKTDEGKEKKTDRRLTR